jgi:hypothetical protein
MRRAAEYVTSWLGGGLGEVGEVGEREQKEGAGKKEPERRSRERIERERKKEEEAGEKAGFTATTQRTRTSEGGSLLRSSAPSSSTTA